MRNDGRQDRAGWRQLDDLAAENSWNAFDELYRFRPGVSPSTWPAIHEPAPSITFDLSTIPDGAPRAAAARAINNEARRCFIWALAGEPMVVLDWQHPTWSFSPTDEASNLEYDSPFSHYPAVFPDGDYYAFLTTDLREGTFGHPWERTLCVMGDRLIRTLGASLSTWLPSVRIDGRAIDQTSSPTAP
ncbi:DUF2716 domain-containing protein [Herbiconiux ginsengi]|uniref:DUF2716 domain-containing protein n=1 Tax=Herbiconiux ginsengi TaxID=381665 RepID=A0A1H3S4M4_9MICO|nr:DUF2716 domain-containing protein [Herbiconiux ginsengi]SDZ32770.1 Protein of unknown function [Herbiconiux ginsengi]